MDSIHVSDLVKYKKTGEVGVVTRILRDIQDQKWDLYLVKYPDETTILGKYFAHELEICPVTIHMYLASLEGDNT